MPCRPPAVWGSTWLSKTRSRPPTPWPRRYATGRSRHATWPTCSSGGAPRPSSRRRCSWPQATGASPAPATPPQGHPADRADHGSPSRPRPHQRAAHRHGRPPCTRQARGVRRSPSALGVTCPAARPADGPELVHPRLPGRVHRAERAMGARRPRPTSQACRRVRAPAWGTSTCAIRTSPVLVAIVASTSSEACRACGVCSLSGADTRWQGCPRTPNP